MKLSSFLALCVAGTVAIAGAAQAQSRNPKDGPAEIPPASFQGKQYVDSKGCVYIRAGVGGLTSWIPRMTRSREVICGFKPTVIAQGNPAVAAPPANGAVQIQPAQAVPQPAQRPVTKPPQPVVVQNSKSPPPRQVAAAPVRSPVTTAPTVIRPAQIPVTMPGQRPNQLALPQVRVPAAAPVGPRVVAVQTTSAPPNAPRAIQVPPTACQGLSPVSARYLSHNRYAVRCGPQAELPYTPGAGQVVAGNLVRPSYAQPDAVPSYAPAQGNTPVPTNLTHPEWTGRQGYVGAYGTTGNEQRTVRRHVAEDRSLTLRGHTPPAGYVPVWKDDRLNPFRTEGTATGEQQMHLVWTATVPRRLIEVNSGRDMTLVFPQIRYNGIRKVKVRVPAHVAQNAYAASTPYVAARNTPATAPVPRISTRTTPPVATTAPVPQPRSTPAQGRVQVGMFSVPANAQNAAQRLKRLGLPARIAWATYRGKRLQVVTSGPFASQADLSRALARARSGGFGDAFIRQ